MKIKVVLIGKTDEKWLLEAIEKYSQRIPRYLPFEMLVLPDLKNSKSMSFDQQKIEEGKLILNNIYSSEKVFLLDENGKEFKSMEFATFLQKEMNAGIKILTFVIGGPYGFSSEVYEKFPQKISLSKMTFSHQMIRVIITEQIYRALSILKNEPYHHQ
ncbi:MAG: 23S rRNA (pseudouridine(1915)-N(3))-methyltransferase RlmH [Bacteroidetes bacterium CG2_30_33_31]|nr:MAG: 23S rRNA (pseudouridine(1915)-N(3))-methyltransferase RlmH [Bacteroidetes bacterium CG2_30_33_31]